MDKRRYYIKLVEEFFKENNKKYFGANLVNFFGKENTPFLGCSNEDCYNSNMVKINFLEKRGILLPYVTFELNNKRIITLLKDDILSVNLDYIEYAINSFINFRDRILGTLIENSTIESRM